MQRKFIELTEVLEEDAPATTNADGSMATSASTTYVSQQIYLNVDHVIKIQDNLNVIDGFKVYRITLPDRLIWIVDDGSQGLSSLLGYAAAN